MKLSLDHTRLNAIHYRVVRLGEKHHQTASIATMNSPMNSSKLTNRANSRLLMVAGVVLGLATLLIGLQLFGVSPSAYKADSTVAVNPSSGKVRLPVSAAKAERRQARNAEREHRMRAQLAAAAIPMSVRLAESRARDGEPAAERPDLEMIRENRGAPLTEEQQRMAADRMIEAGRRAMRTGDLGLVYEHFFRATETYPSVETHAVLGALLLKTRVSSSADYHLRWAAEHDAGNPDRWIALANAYALKPDPGAAYKAVSKAREIDPAIDIVRNDGGFFERRG